MWGIKRKYLAFFLAILFALQALPALNLQASPTTRERLQELERARSVAGAQVREQQHLLEGTRYEMSQLMTEMQELDQRQMDVAEALAEIEISLLTTEERIYEATEHLDAARADRDMQRDVFGARLRAMHEQGSVGLLEVLFQAENIGDFFMRWEDVRAVAQFDQEVLAQLELAETQYLSALDTYSRDRTLIIDLRIQHEAVEAELELALEERREWLYSLADDIALLDEYLAILEAEAHQLDAEFGLVQRLHQAELAEAERRRREEERARQEAARQARLAELNDFGGNFAWPVPARADVSSGFGNRTNPVTRRQEFHRGIDIGAPSGTRIVAAADGIVRSAGWSNSFGNYIIIDHAGGYSTLYAHNVRNLVSAGARVTARQHIADVGSTGQSTGPHLHFEIRLNGVHQNPMNYFR